MLLWLSKYIDFAMYLYIIFIRRYTVKTMYSISNKKTEYNSK